AGMEIDIGRLKGRLIALVGAGMMLSLLLALGIGVALHAAGVTQAPILVAIILAATGLGLVLPILKDSGLLDTQFGRVVTAGATVGEFSTIILLSLLFSRESSSPASRLVLLAGFAVGTVGVGLLLLRVTMSMRTESVFRRLQDTTAQIRVRFAVVIFIAFAALANTLGLETILGAFIAGAVLKIVDRDAQMSHPLTVAKLEGLGFGFLVPVFFVTSGLRFDTHALFASASTISKVPIFLVALLLIRGLPALVYRPLLDVRRVVAAGLFQATSLSFIVAGTQIGLQLGLISHATAAALVAAGLLSVVLFPPLALGLLSKDRAATVAEGSLARQPEVDLALDVTPLLRRAQAPD
ncbi:MAG: cation:proton antiporter, partial [Candidatus Dormibacteraeota bacterium]|nr:cation:proton antiporter [Candidatus Dormibacteraeota bacterium]